MNKEEEEPELEAYVDSHYVFVCSKMHPTTGLYEIAGVLVEDEDAEAFLAEDGIRKVEVFIVGRLQAPINVYFSLEEFNGSEDREDENG